MLYKINYFCEADPEERFFIEAISKEKAEEKFWENLSKYEFYNPYYKNLDKIEIELDFTPSLNSQIETWYACLYHDGMYDGMVKYKGKDEEFEFRMVNEHEWFAPRFYHVYNEKDEICGYVTEEYLYGKEGKVKEIPHPLSKNEK